MRLVAKLTILFALLPLAVSARVDCFVPQPQSVKVLKGATTFAPGSTVGYGAPALKPAAEYAAKALQQVCGIEFVVTKGKGSITLKLDAKNRAEGAYRLEVSGGNATVAGADYGGVINGITPSRRISPLPSIAAYCPFMPLWGLVFGFALPLICCIFAANYFCYGR